MYRLKKVRCLFFNITVYCSFVIQNIDNQINYLSGKTIKLEPNDMLPYSEYYVGKILEYKIVQQPTFGNIKSAKSKINRFTYKQLEAGNIHYIHDGSENSTDTIRLIGISKNKESVPFDLIISIIPINDEIPQIVTNTGLQMWIGGRGVLKKIDLSKLMKEMYIILFILHNYNVFFF